MKNVQCFVLISMFAVCSISSAVGRTFPEDKLPSYITPLTEIGQRADFSLDGDKVLYLSRAGGHIYEIDIHTKEIRSITEQFDIPEGWGYYRAFYLSNGDYLLTGGPKRHEAYLQILDKRLNKAPKVFDFVVREGPAVSRTDMNIAYTQRQDKIWTAAVSYSNKTPSITNHKLIIDNRNVIVDSMTYTGMIEPQNFRPPSEAELIWAQYGNTASGIFTSEVFGYHLLTGAIVNYSKAPNQYDEPEGIFPSGEYTLVECDRHNPQGTSKIDIYMLKLDGTANSYQRLTYFSEVEGFRATNPVISDDGRYMCFQESKSDSPPGAGEGLYLYDLQKAGYFEKTK